MRWVIHVASPPGEQGRHWGDTRFASGLAAALKGLGHEARIACADTFGRAGAQEASLVLRGRRRVTQLGGSPKILWIISHPEEIDPAECERFDVVFTCSEAHARWLADRIGRQIGVLMQCTDPHVFHPPRADAARRGFVFFGNTRGVVREAVFWAVASGVPLEVIGKGWEDTVAAADHVATSMDAGQTAAAYRRASVTLNDHWPDMRRWGFVNNRTFDALGCGLPVICDHHPQAAALFPGAVLTYATRSEFEQCLRRVWFEYPLLLREASSASDLIMREHGFSNRAERLLEAASVEVAR